MRDHERIEELLARAERFVGTEGGGMDQAVSLLAEEGEAMKIDFFPLRTRGVPIPEGFRFVLCNSLVRAAKSAEARGHFNRRVVECRLAMLMVQEAGGKVSDICGGQYTLESDSIAASKARRVKSLTAPSRNSAEWGRAHF